MSFDSGSFYDQPSGGGGPTSGQTQAQVDARIRSLVAAQALSGNTQAWPGNKVTVVIPDTDGITEGSNNLFHTTARVLAVAAARLGYFTAAGSGTRDLTPSGNSTDITAAMLNKVVDFRGDSLSADHTLNMSDAVGVLGDVMLIVNEASATSGYTLTVNGQIRFGKTGGYVLHHADAIMFFKTGGNNALGGWRPIALWNVDTGIFGLADQTAADDGKILEWDNDNDRFILVDKPTGGGGGTALTAQGLVDLINNDEGNVDAALDTAGSKVALTGTAGGGSFTLNMANLRPVLNTTLLVDSTLNKTVDTTGNTITLGVASSSPVTGTHTAYFGAQTGNSFASYDVNNATGTFDVSQSGASFWTQTDASPRGVLTDNGDYFYILVPADRSITSISRTEGGSNNLTSYPEVTGITINGTAYEARTLLNGSGVQGYNHVFVTVE